MTTATTTAEKPTVLLTRSELEVLKQLVRDGADNATIGQRLYVTEETVKTHMSRLLRKTGMGSRTALAVAVLRDEFVVQAPITANGSLR